VLSQSVGEPFEFFFGPGPEHQMAPYWASWRANSSPSPTEAPVIRAVVPCSSWLYRYPFSFLSSCNTNAVEVGESLVRELQPCSLKILPEMLD
jgi:hypothetical protein